MNPGEYRESGIPGIVMCLGGRHGPESLAGGVFRLMAELLASDVPWPCQVIDFVGLVAAAHFCRHACEAREPWRAATEATAAFPGR